MDLTLQVTPSLINLLFETLTFYCGAMLTITLILNMMMPKWTYVNPHLAWAFLTLLLMYRGLVTV